MVMIYSYTVQAFYLLKELYFLSPINLALLRTSKQVKKTLLIPERSCEQK